jgi:tRNA modification GTPase
LPRERLKCDVVDMRDQQSRPTAARITAAGRSAIASISVDGHGAVQCVEPLFRRRRPMTLSPVAERRILFGKWLDADSDLAEEVVVCVHGPTRVEIHCHGGDAAATRILQSLGRAGCRLLSSRQWLAANDADLLTREAQWALTQAVTTRVAAILLDQSRGALHRQITRLLQGLADAETDKVRCSLETLRERSAVGCHLVRGWHVVLVGRPNVGKSSLINALLGYQRAIVFDRAGTTRDVVTAGTAIDGWPARFSDTAGIARDAEAVEAAAVELAWQQVAGADLVVFVSDASGAWTKQDDRIWRRVGNRGLVVHNKSDLVAETPGERPQGMLVSASQGQGLRELVAAISRRLVPDPPAPGSPVPFNRRQADCVDEAIAALDRRRPEAAQDALRRLIEGE